jgi:hypothetical protein
MERSQMSSYVTAAEEETAVETELRLVVRQPCDIVVLGILADQHVPHIGMRGRRILVDV